MEFGSDFHLCDFPKGESLLGMYGASNLYIDGRQALIALIVSEGWRRVWMPTYYCYEVVDSVARYAEVKLYRCLPNDDLAQAVSEIDCGKDDAVVVVNYFGLSCNPGALVGKTIVEDHSHDPASHWARNSKADWCFASLRKTLPTADGGVLWSPRGHRLPPKPSHNNQSEELAEVRYGAMALKRDYLSGADVDKVLFRRLYMATEQGFDLLPLSSISHKSSHIVRTIDVGRWYGQKRQNWLYLVRHLKHNSTVEILGREMEVEDRTPFSLVLRCADESVRNRLRDELIRNEIYPAILWAIPHATHTRAQALSKCLLSIHCDGRYGPSQIATLTDRINHILE